MPEIYLVKDGDCMRPVDDYSREQMNKTGDGEVVRVKLFQARNARFHRLFFAVLDLAFSNQEKYLSREGFRFAVSVQAGFIEEVIISDSKTAYRVKSIAWDKMDQAEFNEYYQAALKAIPELLPQFEGVDLEAALLTGDLT